MSLTKTLTDKLKEAPTATSLFNLSILHVNSSGSFVKVPLKTSLDVENLDTLIEQGVYRLSPSAIGTRPNQDWQYGIVEVFQRYAMVIQRIMVISGEMAIRGCSDATTLNWSNWKIATS